MQPLVIREKVLGPDALYTAVALNGLATLYQKQEKYIQAEQLFLRILTIRENALGLKHPKTIAALSDLINLYRTQGKHEQADSLLKDRRKSQEPSETE